jgi:large subunit ribosomal protein L6
MSRIAKAPVTLPAGVELSVNGTEITVKGSNTSLSKVVNDSVTVEQSEGTVTFAPKEGLLMVGHMPVLSVHL